MLIKLNFVCGNSKFEKLGFELYLLVLHIVSALAVFFVLNSLLSKEKLRNNRVLKIMGKYNFIIYLFHQQIIWMVLAVLFNCSSEYFIFGWCFVLAIIVPLGIGIICTQLKWSRSALGMK